MKKAEEHAAGGIVERRGKLLLVQVTNLAGEVKWTFPKGHLEKGEKPLEAALREVEEETGWRCEAAGALPDVEYWFNRNGRPVHKRVSWYRMKPIKKTGKPDALEIMKTRWVPLESGAKYLSYPGDLKILKEVS
jgi:8-oxo-dGTP pyrophosphatase MutT (NUDIX family)